MSIDPNIIIGLSTALGAGIGGAISYLAARRQYQVDGLKSEIERLRRDYVDACEQIEAFHKIEETHAREAAKLSNKTETQVKLEVRKIVEDLTGLRPDWSALEARRAARRVRTP